MHVLETWTEAAHGVGHIEARLVSVSGVKADPLELGVPHVMQRDHPVERPGVLEVNIRLDQVLRDDADAARAAEIGELLIDGALHLLHPRPVLQREVAVDAGMHVHDGRAYTVGDLRGAHHVHARRFVGSRVE